MSYSSQTSPNSESNNISSKLASHYATAALGIGLLVLGVVMILWSMLPADTAGTTPDSLDVQTVRNTSSVGFVLLGTGVAMMLLSLVLGAQNKYRTRRLENGENNSNPEQGQEGERYRHTNKTMQMHHFLHVSMYVYIYAPHIFI